MRRPMTLIGCAGMTLALSGCGGGSGGGAPSAATGPPPTTLFVLTAPALATPENGAEIEQNDPTTGCPFDNRRGYGFEATFSWAESDSSAGVASYELLVHRPQAQLAAIHESITATTYVWRSCNVFVAEPNLTGWEWRVRAIDRNAQVSDWSDTRAFNFRLCRVGGRQCRT